MQIPPGFNVSALFADFVRVSAPLIGIVFIVAVFSLINRVLKRG